MTPDANRCETRVHQSRSDVRVKALAVVIAAGLLLTCVLAARWSRGGTNEDAHQPLPTWADLRQMHDAAQYRTCLHQIARLMRAGGSPKTSAEAKAHERFDLLLLRGDCLLHLEDSGSAQTAYAAVKDAPDEQQAQEARAMSLLIARSPKLTYTPRSGEGGGDGINIAEHSSRKAALIALLEDELRAGRVEFDRAAGTAESLPPIIAVLPKLRDLYAVERTATGQDQRVRPILQACGERARTLIGRELDVQEQRVSSIEERANQIVSSVAYGNAWWGGSTRRGLYTPDRVELGDVGRYLVRILDTTKLGREAALSFGADGRTWEPLIDQATRAVRHAQDVLDNE